MTPLEQWLSDATRDLSPESAARVRAEIEQHYDSARESGGDAIAALGDPRAANREYRKVLLTDTEAMMAPVLTQKRTPSSQSRFFGLLILAAIYRTSWGKQHDPGFWPVQIAIFSALPLSWLLPQTTQEESRTFLYVHGARNLIVVAVAWWYQGWAIGLSLGALCFLLDYFVSYRRLLVFRKLDAGQTYGPLPGEPTLRIIKWAAMGVAAVLPVLFGARIPWAGAAYMALFFVMFDLRNIALRGKLPIEEWPKRLYF